MSRHKNDGLKYFSLDTDFFYSDRRIKALRARYGSDGLIFFIYLLTEIYRNGYYIRWDDDAMDNAVADLNLTEGLIKQIMTFLVSRSLLMQFSILGLPDTIITSPGIQKRYQESTKGLKREVCVDAQIWVLEEEETASFIKVIQNKDFSEKKVLKSGEKDIKSEKKDINEIKINEKKEENKDTLCKADALALFERLWKLYPCKKGKGQVSDAGKKRLLQIGFDEMSRAIERYLAELEKDKDWRKPQNGSTFFNSGYIDYLDANYEASSKQTGSRIPFNDFQQREYDNQELENFFIREVEAMNAHSTDGDRKGENKTE